MSPKKKAAATSSAPQESDALKVVRELHLKPGDRFLFLPEKQIPLSLPTETKPFDKSACVKKAATVCRSEYFWSWRLDGIVDEQKQLSVEEATFWLKILTRKSARLSGKAYADALKKETEKFVFKGVPTVKELAVLMDETSDIGETGYYLLRHLFGVEEIFEILFQREKLYYSGIESALLGLSRRVLPYVDADTLVRLRKKLKSKLASPIILPPVDEVAGVEVYLASLLGFSEELESTLSKLPDDRYANNSWQQIPHWLVFGLETPEKVAAEMKRLHLCIDSPERVRVWLGRTGFAGIDYLFECLEECLKNKHGVIEIPMAMVKQFLQIVDSPETAPLALKLKQHHKVAGLAGDWFEQHPGNAICGLLPLVAQKGKLADQAVEFLRIKKRQGASAFIEQCLAGMPPEVGEAVRREILDHEEIVYPPLELADAPKSLRNAFADETSLAKTKLPGWIAPEMLPPLPVGKSALTGQQVTFLLKALKSSDFGMEKTHPAVLAVKESVSENFRSAFVWKLFEIWLGEGAPSKENWAMKALGMLGGDDAALKLTPLVRVWPGESQHKRAVLGLECLRAIGTDTALMQLNGISQKLKFQGLKKQAAAFMEEIAKARGMTRPELEDRVVPDCELDENGRRIFDFGPRQFEFGLGPDLKPMVRGDDGKFKADLPKPNSKDDPDKSAEAVADWKRMKKQIREVVKLQSVRLEEAMIAGRSWSGREFEQLLVRHPLMGHLVRLILWGIFDEKGKFVTAFRVTDESDFADENDKPTKLPTEDALRIRVVHPLNFTEEQKRRWGEVLSDYELIPPFRQLGREVFALDPARSGETDLNPKPIGKLPGVSLAGLLDKSGWQRALPADAGGFYEHTKPFYGANVTAVCQYDPGLFAGGGPEYWDEQTVTHFFFIPGIYSPDDWYPDHKNRVKLKDVDPIVLCESLAVLKLIESKTK